jgi:hypothetical protein
MHSRLLSIAALVIAAFSAGCSRLPLSFDVNTRSRTVIEKGTVIEQLVGTLGFGEFTNLDLSESQEFRSNDVQKRHVASARVKNLVLTITAPQGQTFDFLERIAFYVEAPGLDRKRIAHAKVPRGAANIQCEIDDLDLASYIRAPSMSITSEVRGRRPDRDTEVQANLRIAIATVLWRGD